MSAVTVLFLALNTFLWAGPDIEKKARDAKKQEKKGFAVAKTGKGPESDNLRPLTASEEKELSNQLAETLKKYPKPTLKVRADGTKSMLIAPYFLNFSVARKGPDGKLLMDCNKDVEKIETSNIDALPEE